MTEINKQDIWQMLDKQTALVQAVEQGDCERVRELVAQGANLDGCTYDDSSMLGVAAHSGQLDVVRYLVGLGASVNEGIIPPVSRAAEAGHVEVVKFLCDNHADLNVLEYPAHLGAVFGGCLEVVRFLVETSCCDQDTIELAVHHAAARNDRQVVNYLLEHDPISFSAYAAALEGAAGGGHVDLFKSLFSKLGDANNRAQIASLLTKNSDAGKAAQEALRAAANRGCEEIITFLVECGVDINTDCHTPAVALAAGGGNLGIVKKLIGYGADVNAGKEPAIVLAAANGSLSMCQFLLKHKADVNTGHGSALSEAAGTGNLTLVKFLFEQGAYINAGDRTALCNAARFGHMDCVRYLLSKGADVNAGCKFEISDTAYNCSEAVIRFLFANGADPGMWAAAAKERAMETEGKYEV